MALKYHGRLSAAPLLGKLLAQTLTQRLGPDPADGIVPIPLHPTRMRERGFNQAIVLAQALAKRLGLPIRKDLLIRHRPTEPQAGLSRAERLANVREAFRLHPDPWVRLKRILLVDDVYTTGATAEACARLLKQAGASTVTAAAIARG
jgi:ComF family protein